MAVHQESSELLSSDGLRLHFVARRPPGQARANVVVIHGLGDHIGLYDGLLSQLSAKGYAAFGLDLRGHGRSAGPRGHILRWDQYTADVSTLLHRVQSGEAGPLFLLGNSMGALVALERGLALGCAIRGVVALSPPFGDVGVPSWLLRLGRVASAVWPSLTLNPRFDLTGVTRDQDALREVLADPLFHRKASARLSTELFATVARLKEQAGRFPVPLLLLHGGADFMVSPAATREFAARVPQERVRYIEYPGAYHSLLIDTNREEVLRDIGEWLEAQVTSP